MFFRNEYKTFNLKEVIPQETIKTNKISEKFKTIDDVIKKGIKVKSTIPTPAGVYYEFFSTNDVEAAEKILNGTVSGKTILVKVEH